MRDSQTYEPQKYFKLGIRIWPQMIREILDSRELIWRLFIRDLTAKYRQALLGNIWLIVLPLIAIGTFMYLNQAGILKIGETDVPYPLFALTGLAVWQLFATGLTSGTNSLVAAGDMIGKINFAREALVISSLAQTIFEFLIKLILILIFCLIFKFVPAWACVLFPLVLLPLLILTVGLSFILALMNAIFRDVAQVVSLGLTFIMFITPVLYPLPQNYALFRFNPLSPLICAPRDLMVYGTLKEPLAYLLATVLSVLVFLCAWRVFHLAESKIPERI